MCFRHLSVLIVLFSVVIVAGSKSFLSEDPYYAKSLTSASFDAELSKDGDLLVLFHTLECEQCRDLLLEYEEAAKSLAQNEPQLKVVLCKVDASKNEDLIKRYGVKQLPSLRYFKENEVQVMDAHRAGKTADDIFTFVKKIASAPDRIMQIVKDPEMRSLVEATGVVAIGSFESSEHAGSFIDVAEQFKYPVRFGWTTNDDLARKHLGLAKEDLNKVVLLTPFDEKRHVFAIEKPLERTKKTKQEMAKMMNTMMGVPLEEAVKLIPETEEQRELKNWIQKFMMPLVVPFEPGYMDLIFQGPLQAHLIAIVDPERDYSDVSAALQEAALANRGNLLHLIMPAIEHTKEIREYFGVLSSKLPAIVFSDMRNATEHEPGGTQTLFAANTKITGANLKNFADEELNKARSSTTQAKNQRTKNSRKKTGTANKKKAKEQNPDL